MKETFISVRVSQEKKDEIQRDADREGRSLSNFVLWLYQKYKQNNEEQNRTSPETSEGR